jgi:nucleotide-binding universal stress UspA family protein
MWLTKGILVPTDFSASSKEAANVAVELAQRFQVPLTLLHVVSIPAVLYTGNFIVPVGDLVTPMEEAARNALAEEAARVKGKGMQVTTVMKSGNPWEDILEAQKTLDAGLIVMGTHGRRGLPRALIGSVAEKVVRLSRVPVLTLHAEEPA